MPARRRGPADSTANGWPTYATDFRSEHDVPFPLGRSPADETSEESHHGGHMGTVRRVLVWLVSPRRLGEEHWVAGTFRCPRCQQQLPGLRSGGISASALGPMWLPPTVDELVAKCPFDGHPPNNDRAKAMLASGALLDTRESPEASDE